MKSSSTATFKYMLSKVSCLKRFLKSVWCSVPWWIVQYGARIRLCGSKVWNILFLAERPYHWKEMLENLHSIGWLIGCIQAEMSCLPRRGMYSPHYVSTSNHYVHNIHQSAENQYIVKWPYPINCFLVFTSHFNPKKYLYTAKSEQAYG